MTPPKSSRINILAGGVLFLLLCPIRRLLIYGDILILQDAHVYSRALSRFNRGLDPYAKDKLYFVYAPIFLKAQNMLSHLLSHRGAWGVYLLLLTVATLSVPLLLSYWLKVEWLSPAVCLVLFALQPYLLAQEILLTGNLSPILYAAGFATGLLGLKRNRWLPFYAVVVVASLIKLPFLAMLLVPLFCSKRQLLAVCISVALTDAAYFAQQIWEPALYTGFRHALSAQIFERADVGFGVLRPLLYLGHHVPILTPTVATCIHLLLFVALFASLWSSRGLRHSPEFGKIWLATLIVLVIAANPRMKEYDACMAFLPELYLAIEAIRFFFNDSRYLTPIILTVVTLVAVHTVDPELSFSLLAFGPVLANLFIMHRVRTGDAVLLPLQDPREPALI